MLDIRLAGIDVSDAGSDYLAKDMRLRSKNILFTAIKPVESNRCVDAEVFYKKVAHFFINYGQRYFLNEMLKFYPLHKLSGRLASSWCECDGHLAPRHFEHTEHSRAYSPASRSSGEVERFR